MKLVMLAASAALCVFALSAQAADAPAPSADNANMAMTPMSDADCAAAMTKCGADADCKKALMDKSGCKPDAAK